MNCENLKLFRRSEVEGGAGGLLGRQTKAASGRMVEAMRRPILDLDQSSGLWSGESVGRSGLVLTATIRGTGGHFWCSLSRRTGGGLAVRSLELRKVQGPGVRRGLVECV